MDTYHYVLYIHLLSLFVGIGAASVLVVCLFQLRKARELTMHFRTQYKRARDLASGGQ